MQKYIFLVFLFSILIPYVALGAIKLNLDYPQFGGFDLEKNQSLPEIIAWVYYFIVGIAALSAFIMLVWGGVQWLISGAIPAQASDARDKIKNALLGLLLVLGSFLIIQLINPELTLFGALVIDPVQGPAHQDENDARGNLLAPPPRGATEPGIYFCANHQCRCNNPRAEKCKEGTGNPGRGSGKDDYYHVGIGVVAEEFGEHQIINLPEKWREEVRSVAVIPSFEGKLGSVDVVLFNETDGNDEVICFNGTGAGRLDDSQLKGKNGWDGDPESFTAFYTSLGMCNFPGLTVDSKADFDHQPVVFFFDKKDFGKQKERTWGRPCKYFNTNPFAFSTHGVHNDEPNDPSKGLGTGKGCEDQPGNKGDTYSVWLVPEPECSMLEGGEIVLKPCTVTLYECDGEDPCKKINPPVGENPEKYDRVCLSKSVENLRTVQYSFDNQDLSNDIRDDIRAVWVTGLHANESCPGIVVTPSPLSPPSPP